MSFAWPPRDLPSCVRMSFSSSPCPRLPPCSPMYYSPPRPSAGCSRAHRSDARKMLCVTLGPMRPRPPRRRRRLAKPSWTRATNSSSGGPAICSALVRRRRRTASSRATTPLFSPSSRSTFSRMVRRFFSSSRCVTAAAAACFAAQRQLAPCVMTALPSIMPGSR